ncbi:hypothetical protein ACTPOK_21255 [Streptomyces inhibens]
MAIALSEIGATAQFSDGTAGAGERSGDLDLDLGMAENLRSKVR